MSHPVFDVRGKVALVTGSSRGLGKAFAHGLAEAGCVVVLNGRDPAAVDETRRAMVRDTGATVLAEAFDVTDPDAVAAGLDRIERRAGPLDILVNNAGVQHRAPFTEFRTEDWHRILETNLSSAFLAGREAARRMTARGRGKIVNICSVQSELARPGIAPYTAAKGGLKMLTKGMCADLGPSGIQVNGLAPGYFDTELNAALVADDQFSAWIRTRTPAGRWGRAEDLVGTLLFLCSPASDFVNGQIVCVDGGMTSVL
ncbi:SDR family oxidoreductase [Amycolatopsis rubida]|uniref:Gluconate 5-dehydrogenase n=1 Tax=Amycolatopsis rubida TaxID=112413 RepID=A0A1I5YJ38_9PSEU|nr:MULTISPECIES: SDR family oxidoreductase [Amycolatopsis]MYW96425.1 SDR family oxidoreductase [Amycolatopsis rubida]NEC61412.1 SDR family oxidoreductase [Amycolatopsis rubida]OAP28117.1 Gluconate 5-dehydrogenase [Amycolatopsis sp. M39]SFQ44226.1 gluconate 5-dehydrogenase [Amycolatopsis rubida]